MYFYQSLCHGHTCRGTEKTDYSCLISPIFFFFFFAEIFAHGFLKVLTIPVPERLFIKQCGYSLNNVVMLKDYWSIQLTTLDIGHN